MKVKAISHQRSAISASHGFSLVEVTLAMAVMAVGLIAILGLIPQGVTSSRNAADNTLAATILHDELNLMRTDALKGTLPTSKDVYYDAPGTNVILNTTPQDQYFHVVLTPTAAALPNLYIVTAVVTWPDKSIMTVPARNTNVFATQIAMYQ